jgi:hypothetical protein
MYDYYALLRRRYQLPVFPVVVYLHGGQGIREQEYMETLFERELLRFRFMSIGLAKLEAKGYVEKSPLDDAKKFLLGNVVETYFGLDEEETKSFRRLLSVKGYREVEGMEGTWADKMMEKGHVEGLVRGREEGHEQGLKDGELKGKREILIRQLVAKFGSVS